MWWHFQLVCVLIFLLSLWCARAVELVHSTAVLLQFSSASRCRCCCCCCNRVVSISIITKVSNLIPIWQPRQQPQQQHQQSEQHQAAA